MNKKATKIKYIHASVMEICKLDMSHIEVNDNYGQNLLSETISDAVASAQAVDNYNNMTANTNNNNVIYDFTFSVSGGSTVLYHNT